MLEEADYKTARELAIAGLNRDRLFDEAWSQRCSEFGMVLSERACMAAVKLAGGAFWRRCRGRHCASVVKRRLIWVKLVFSKVSRRHSWARRSRAQSASACVHPEIGDVNGDSSFPKANRNRAVQRCRWLRRATIARFRPSRQPANGWDLPRMSGEQPRSLLFLTVTPGRGPRSIR